MVKPPCERRARLQLVLGPPPAARLSSRTRGECAEETNSSRPRASRLGETSDLASDLPVWGETETDPERSVPSRFSHGHGLREPPPRSEETGSFPSPWLEVLAQVTAVARQAADVLMTTSSHEEVSLGSCSSIEAADSVSAAAHEFLEPALEAARRRQRSTFGSLGERCPSLGFRSEEGDFCKTKHEEQPPSEASDEGTVFSWAACESRQSGYPTSRGMREPPIHWPISVSSASMRLPAPARERPPTFGDRGSFCSASSIQEVHRQVKDVTEQIVDLRGRFGAARFSWNDMAPLHLDSLEEGCGRSGLEDSARPRLQELDSPSELERRIQLLEDRRKSRNSTPVR
ncbi:unnamed protein product [Polarella glacialis]|uniref:Uncharacterized protein n=1 Tax=Polarella glacialis TaxID=89957 RepID=A0A813FDI9_POLGL|nr:unnamed protein product [Polarella glacialis]